MGGWGRGVIGERGEGGKGEEGQILKRYQKVKASFLLKLFCKIIFPFFSETEDLPLLSIF